MKIRVRLQLHGAIYRPDSFVLMLRYCANLKAIRYESTSLNRMVADKSHRVIVALIRYHFVVAFCIIRPYILQGVMINVSKTGSTESFSKTQFMVHRTERIRNILCYFPRI